jgi:hypothetical protein
MQHVHAGKAGTDHDHVVAPGAAWRGRNWGGHGSKLPNFLVDLAASILSAAPKRKRQNGSGDILQGGTVMLVPLIMVRSPQSGRLEP